MTIRVLWAPQAREDLLDIYTLIGLEQPRAAERYFDRIEYLVSMLADMPGLGVAHPDIAPSLRMLTERPYLILYRISPDDPAGKVDTLEVVRIADGRRDLSDLF